MVILLSYTDTDIDIDTDTDTDTDTGNTLESSKIGIHNFFLTKGNSNVYRQMTSNFCIPLIYSVLIE